MTNDPVQQRLNQLAGQGIAALQRGDHGTARRAFDEVCRSGRASPQAWLFLAQACHIGDDRPSCRAALDEVLKGDKDNPYALVMHGELMTRDGDDRGAVHWYERALRSAQGRQVPQDLIERLNRADAEREAATGRMRAALDRTLTAAGAIDAGPRFAEALDFLAGRAQPMLQQPTSFYFPGLPQQAFHDPTQFAWARNLAAAHAAITAEVTAVLAERAGLAPYVERVAGRHNKAHPLMADPRWSAFYLYRDGEVVPEHAARCPATMAALAQAPLPRIKGQAPMVLFSILAPGTHIPPHNGMLNTRLICHLPLIVPPDCALRVGNHTRQVKAGEVLLFDDSIEHEAWNRSDQPRAILLFEVWRPDLTDAEKAALTVMYETVTQYGADQA